MFGMLCDDGDVVCVGHGVSVWLCWCGDVVGEEVELCRGENGALGDAVLEVSCCGWLASLCGVCVSACEEVGQLFLLVVVDVVYE